MDVGQGARKVLQPLSRAAHCHLYQLTEGRLGLLCGSWGVFFHRFSCSVLVFTGFSPCVCVWIRVYVCLPVRVCTLANYVGLEPMPQFLCYRPLIVAACLGIISARRLLTNHVAVRVSSSPAVVFVFVRSPHG